MRKDKIEKRKVDKVEVKTQVQVEVKVNRERVYKSFKEMPIWNEAMEIAVEIHKLTENLPKKEDYGFTLLSKFQQSILNDLRCE